MEDRKHTIEYFILHSELNEIARENDFIKLETFKQLYPEQEEDIMQAFILLQNLKVHQKSVPQEQIENDYKLLLNEIKRRKRKNYSLWIGISSAACICLVFIMSVFLKVSTNDMIDQSSRMLSLLDSLTVEVDDVQIVSGSIKASVPNNQTITQTDEGDFVVGKEEKLKSSDIETEFVQLVVPNGKRTNIKFHDGTIAWLNSGSKLIYPKVFAKDKREIFIEGEIYIHVEKAKDKPFVVHAKEFDVTVLGTTFNVNAYTEDSENSIVLVEGSVEVMSENKKQKLLPNQGLFLDNGIIEVKSVDTYHYICWKDGIMKIDGESLANIFNRLARHYNVRIQLENENLFAEKYKGRLNLADNLEEVLTYLSASIPFAYEKKTDNSISISMKN